MLWFFLPEKIEGNKPTGNSDKFSVRRVHHWLAFRAVTCQRLGMPPQRRLSYQIDVSLCTWNESNRMYLGHLRVCPLYECNRLDCPHIGVWLQLMRMTLKSSR